MAIAWASPSLGGTIACLLLCAGLANASSGKDLPREPGNREEPVANRAAAEAVSPGGSGPGAPGGGSGQQPSAAGAQSNPPWKIKLEQLTKRRDLLSTDLSQLHGKLRDVVTAQRPDLLARLDKEAPKPARTGYGIVPPIKADDSGLPATSPVEQSYSIGELGPWLDREQAQLAELGSRLELHPAPLEKEIDFYNQRADTFRNIDGHFGYHFFWQDQVLKWPLFWERKKQLLAMYRGWRESLQHGKDAPVVLEARNKLEKEMLKVAPAPALCLKPASSGPDTLTVRVATDVTDEAFLAAFSSAVERHWNESQAMKEANLRIDLAWDRVSPGSLYPEGAPRHGERIDAARHRKRFQAPLVLTTGVESTHVLDGAIFLGARPVTPSVLAHEFAHLIGFDDAYIRAYDGSGEDPDGVVFREVTPFPESLLASPRRGKVTPRMVEVLREAYKRCE